MNALITLIGVVTDIIWFAVFARILLSWFRVDPYNPIVRFLTDFTDPILNPFRRLIPPIGMFDISPIVALVVIRLARDVIIFIIVSIF